MPTVKRDALLASTYKNVRNNIRNLPTQLLYANQVLYRSIDPHKSYSSLPKPKEGEHLSKALVDGLLRPADGVTERGNRFSGPAYGALRLEGSKNGRDILCAAGLYVSIQTQALMNEMAHYKGRRHATALEGQCILQMRVRIPILVADLSQHNPGAMAFLKGLGTDVYEQMRDPVDCSVARGIGLAVAHSYCNGLIAETVRESERSPDERGDNLVLFGTTKRPLDSVVVESVQYYNQTDHTVETVIVDSF